MAKSLGTNAVIVTRVHCTTMHLAVPNMFLQLLIPKGISVAVSLLVFILLFMKCFLSFLVLKSLSCYFGKLCSVSVAFSWHFHIAFVQ